MDVLELISDFQPTGDQPEAIRELVEGFRHGARAQTLLGVTGSGKTFTAANVLAQLNRPALILSHNKTLAAQLYSEFKEFFPNNRVEYFVSYYDYYQPEAYIPSSDTYIEKDLSINMEIEKLRLSTTSALLSGRKDVIVVSSVSCLYGIGNPVEFHRNTIHLRVGMALNQEAFLRSLVAALYQRNDVALSRGSFRVRGDTVDVAVAYDDYAYRVIFFGNEVERIQMFDPLTFDMGEDLEETDLYPARNFVTTQEVLNQALHDIQDDLVRQVDYFEGLGKKAEAQRLLQRVEYDMEMLRELGYCQGVENYSRYFDRRPPGSRPFCLLDYFPDDFLLIVDESHVTIPQIRAMYGGDRSRKVNLVEYGFRLPAALDNRPLRFEEFEAEVGQQLYISATPAEYELERSGGVIVEQLIRPTGVLDPIIDVRPIEGQIDDLLGEIRARAKRNERVLVTTLTKRMAEHLSEFLLEVHVKCRYIHSDVETLERVAILDGLRRGDFNVLIGVNLLREGLDLPEVSLVAILDADKEGFLRSARSLTQTAGRAARNVNGCVIMYADRITESMRQTIEETNRRREKQIRYNQEHGITPRQIVKRHRPSLLSGSAVEGVMYPHGAEAQPRHLAAEEEASYRAGRTLQESIQEVMCEMHQAAKARDFGRAAQLRDLMFELQAEAEGARNPQAGGDNSASCA